MFEAVGEYVSVFNEMPFMRCLLFVFNIDPEYEWDMGRRMVENILVLSVVKVHKW